MSSLHADLRHIFYFKIRKNDEMNFQTSTRDKAETGFSQMNVH